jgi:hypothetical protein
MTVSAPPLVSIVIPCWNQRVRIIPCDVDRNEIRGASR